MNALIKLITGRRSKWAVVTVGIVAMAAFTPIAIKDETTTDQTAFLPSAAQSTVAVDRLKTLPGSQNLGAIVVYARADGKLTAADQAKIASDRVAFATLASQHAVSPAIPSDGGQASIVSFSLPAKDDPSTVVKQLRQVTHSGLPVGLTAQITGAAGFSADETGAFGGLNGKLLIASILVVAILLILTYRSPWLWLVPLVVVGIADQVAGGIVNLLAIHAGLVLNGENTGILRVLVFGAGTDYALLLIARYREELHREESKYAAMRKALREAGPAILASGITVTLALLSLLASSLNSDKSLGPVGAVGILTALFFALTVLPAALLLFGRGLFWPRVPHVDQANPTESGLYARVAKLVGKRPRLIAIGSTLLLCIACLGLVQLKIGLTQTQQLLGKNESVDGQATITKYFPAGDASPLVVVSATAKTATVAAMLREDSHVRSVSPGAHDDTWSTLTVILSDDPESAAADTTIRRLRASLGTVQGADAVVGGPSAVDLDTADAAQHDRAIVIPIILAIVFLVLIILLRSFIAPLILLGTVVLSFLASFGLSYLIFIHLLHLPALDQLVPLLGFVFLVALGVDYNIFLVTRAAEEAQIHGPIMGMQRALAVTGGVITSAGLVLAATFAVLSILPIIVLTQVGVLVALGVLIDTLLVRSLFVPALAIMLRNGFWWPRRFPNTTKIK